MLADSFFSTNRRLVGEALVRYVNLGVTLGAVNLPEVNLRSLTMDEPNHVRVCRYEFYYGAVTNKSRSSIFTIMFQVF